MFPFSFKNSLNLQQILFQTKKNKKIINAYIIKFDNPIVNANEISFDNFNVILKLAYIFILFP